MSITGRKLNDGLVFSQPHFVCMVIRRNYKERKQRNISIRYHGLKHMCSGTGNKDFTGSV